MTDTDNAASQDLASLKLPELRKIAAEKGLRGTSALRKGELIQAITTGTVPQRARQRASEQAVADNAGSDSTPSATSREGSEGSKPRDNKDNRDNNGNNGNNEGKGDEQRYESRSAARRARRNRAKHGDQNEHKLDDGATPEDRGDQGDDQRESRDNQDDRDGRNERNDRGGNNGRGGNRNNNHRGGENGRGNDDRGQRDGRDDRNGNDNDHGNGNGNGENNRGGGNNRDNRDNNNDGGGNGGGGRRGRRNRRNRRNRDNHNNGGGNNQNNHNNNGQDLDPEELQEVAGIVDIVDNNAAFVRTTGYRANQADVFINNNLVRRCGLRSGDAVIGQVRANGQGHTHGNGRNRQRYNQLVRVDTVNGMTVDEAKQRAEFHKLTPLYPNQRLRLETEPNILTTRVIDLVMPIGKGQRALIVSPPKAGKTTILQNIANAIAHNNPECYLMVVLVDERPEEVTDMQRSVKGEVIASTFDRPPAEHTAVAELAIERAKRLVEMGQDVVVLLDSITRLGRAYNNSSPASGRILSGGVDSNALYPPKRFLGAARNIEEGGSLTIIATAMVETGSAGDTVIFEEFKGTGNAELKLDRKIAERRVFPAVDVNPSGTRKDELLMSPEEARVMHKLRRILSALDPQQSIDMLIKQLKKTKNNGEFLVGVAQSAPMAADQESEDYQ
ncbi:transcription termination factor Rho [Corynebacterium sp. P3-F1]|uniref:transcription termination factor Rho n=1 Tax=Corynebacterium sp. P3-F1 TaxID=3059080 RepID=UPI00265CFBE2|nr:transcription termination factor Rho [Corynebacterium sp. P3-F1]WKK61353.1 transcription termination factor Rho [Corynebacterium sp. P3-F1]